MEFEKLQSIIAEVVKCEPDEIALDTRFEDDLNVDSLDFCHIVMAIEDEFEIEISDDVAKDIVTVGDAVNQIKQVVH